VGSLTEGENAWVAPPEARADGAAAGGFGSGGIGGIGAGKIGGAGATYDTGGGGTISSFEGSGKIGPESPLARGRTVDGGAVVLEVREGASGVNHPVNPVPAGSFPAIPDAGRDASGTGFSGPNMAVKSPTVFRGGSICCEDEDTAGVSNGLSPRNGP